MSELNRQEKEKQGRPKSPLIFLSTMAILIIATLVVASAYFLKPNIESELKRELRHELARHLSVYDLLDTRIKVSGRDVTLLGYVSTKKEAQQAEAIARQITGIREVENQLMIKTYPSD